MTELIRLRELPGVERIEQLCRHPPNFEPPHATYNYLELNEVSVRLFGITLQDTFNDDNDDDVVSPYDVVYLNWPESQPFWELAGWDQTNAAGEDLLCLPFFGRQIVAVVRGLIEGAKYYPLANGVEASSLHALSVDNESAISAALQAEADAFIKGRTS